MRQIVGPVCVITLLLAGVPVRADGGADARAVIDKAIKAHGGADNLKKVKATVAKSKGKFYGMGEQGLDYTAESQVQQPDRSRIQVDSEAGGMKFTFIQAFKGDKGWRKFNDNVEDLNKEEVAEQKAQLYAENVARLYPLTDKAYKLSPLGAVKVGDRPAVGIRVERKDHRDISLFFDKEKGLLLKSESRGKDIRADKEFTAETFYGDYKKVDGVMVPHKVTIKRDGKPFVESEVTEVKHPERLEDSAFAKP